MKLEEQSLMATPRCYRKDLRKNYPEVSSISSQTTANKNNISCSTRLTNASNKMSITKEYKGSFRGVRQGPQGNMGLRLDCQSTANINSVSPWTMKAEVGGRVSPATLKLIDEICTSNAEINTPDIMDIDKLTFPADNGFNSTGHFENSFQLNNIDVGYGVPNDSVYGIDPLLSSPTELVGATSHNDMYIAECEQPMQIDDPGILFDEYLYEPNGQWSPDISSFSCDANSSTVKENILSEAVKLTGIVNKEETDDSFFNFDSYDNINVLNEIDKHETFQEESTSWCSVNSPALPEPSPLFVDPNESMFNGFSIKVEPGKRKRKPPQRYQDEILIEEVAEDFNETVTVSIDEPAIKRNKFSLKGLSDSEKYKRIREQNNAASKKCRQKRKELLNSKAYELEELQSKNEQLQKKYDKMKLMLQNLKTEWQRRQSKHVG